jgi:hypothetical protein
LARPVQGFDRRLPVGELGSLTFVLRVSPEWAAPTVLWRRNASCVVQAADAVVGDLQLLRMLQKREA